MSSTGPLPPPLIPLPKRRASDCEPAEEEEGREAPTLPQDLGTNVGFEEGGEPEVAAEAYSEMGGSPQEDERDELSDSELDDRGTESLRRCCTLLVSVSTITFSFPFAPCSVPSPYRSPDRAQNSQESQEEFDSLFDSELSAEDQVPSPKAACPPQLSDNDLAEFDPCYKPGDINTEPIPYCCVAYFC